MGKGKDPRAGFTLIEVMVALAIMAIASAAAFAAFELQQRSYLVQMRVAEMQQNLRAAIEVLSRDLRMAGYGTPGGFKIPNTIIPGAAAIRGIHPVDNTAGPDSIYIAYMYDMDPNQPTGTVFSHDTGETKVNDNAVYQKYRASEFIIVSNRAAAEMFQVTSDPAANQSLIHATSNSYNDTTLHTAVLTSGNTVSKARFVRYYIATDNVTGRPTLMMDRMQGSDPQPVADDIEDMQFQYSLDTNGDGAIDVTDNNTVVNPANIRQVHVYLLARTRQTEKDWKDNVSRSMANHGTGVLNDGYRRRVVDFIVDVRNSSFN